MQGKATTRCINMRDVNREYNIRIEDVVPLIIARFIDEKNIERMLNIDKYKI